MTISYTTGIPDANHNPSVDQPKMQVNNDNIKQIIGIDHCTFDPTSMAQISGQHLKVTFPEGQSDPALTQVQTQLYPKLFGTGTQLLETYTAARMSNSAQINGYLPFVKCMFKFTGSTGPYPADLTPPSNNNVVNVNIGSITQTSTTSVTVTFATALPYTTYRMFPSIESDPAITSAVITKNLTSIVFSGFLIGSRTFSFMVI
jgi:hypothetical protein